MRDKVEALFAENAGGLNKALKKLGIKVDKQAEKADDALAGVRALVGHYDALFRKLLAATENAARAKLSIALQIEEARTQAQAVEIAGSFLADDDTARQAFRALTRGDFTALIRLIDTGGAPGFVLDPNRSSLKRYASSSGRLGFELVLVDFGASASEMLRGEASILVDGTGNVQVDATGRLDKRFRGADAQQEITLISSYALVRARALATAPASADRSMGLAITVGHIDKRLERHEVERFVGSLADADLIDPAAKARAREVHTAWSGNPANKARLEATVQMKLALDRTALGHLLMLPHGPGGLADSDGRRIVRCAFDALADSTPQDRSQIDATIAFLAKTNPKLSLDDLLMDEGRTRRELRRAISGTKIIKIPPEHEAFADAMRLSHAMLAMIRDLRAIYFSTPELRSDSDASTWSPADYRDAQRAAAGAAREWLQLNAVLFWTNSKVHPRTLAFLQTLTTLARVDAKERISLTLWRNGPQGTPETVVLTHAPGLA